MSVSHGERPLPREVTDPRVKEWEKYVGDDLKKRFSPEADLDHAVADATEYSIGGVQKRIQKTALSERDQEAAYFYALFSFTNFDNWRARLTVAGVIGLANCLETQAAWLKWSPAIFRSPLSLAARYS